VEIQESLYTISHHTQNKSPLSRGFLFYLMLSLFFTISRYSLQEPALIISEKSTSLGPYLYLIFSSNKQPSNQLPPPLAVVVDSFHNARRHITSPAHYVSTKKPLEELFRKHMCAGEKNRNLQFQYPNWLVNFTTFISELNRASILYETSSQLVSSLRTAATEKPS